MKFSTRAEYGLRAMISLAQNYPQVKSIKEIANECDYSLKYLERLAGELKKGGLLKSYKGQKGGYLLKRKPNQISVGEVIETLEGSIAPMKCSAGNCPHIHICPSSKVWIKLGKVIRKSLYSVKLASLIDTNLKANNH